MSQICPHGGHRQISARESKSHILFKLFWDLFGISPALILIVWLLRVMLFHLPSEEMRRTVCKRCAGRRQEKPVCSLCRSTGGILAEGAPPNCHAMLHNISCLSCKLNQKSGLAACFHQGFTVLVLWPWIAPHTSVKRRGQSSDETYCCKTVCIAYDSNGNSLPWLAISKPPQPHKTFWKQSHLYGDRSKGPCKEF